MLKKESKNTPRERKTSSQSSIHAEINDGISSLGYEELLISIFLPFRKAVYPHLLSYIREGIKELWQ